MTHTSVTSADVALQVVQQAVTVLAKWAGVELPPEYSSSTDYPVCDRVKRDILPWPSGTLQPLRLLVDRVTLDKGQNKVHYWPATEIEDNNPLIPYPQPEPPTSEQINALKQRIQKALSNLNREDWRNLSLLTLVLEKFATYLSFGESDVALIDVAKTTAAVASAIANRPDATELTLIAGDLSGIQKFIYTISSDGALKSLRARSFYLELVTEEVVQQLLAALQLPRTNIIYAGGGNLYLLAAATEDTKQAIENVRQQFNQWFFDEFQGKIFLALDCLNFPIQDVATEKFATYWADVTKSLAQQKSRKFAHNITQLLQQNLSHELCRVCHRDDVKTLKSLNPREPDSVLACDTCCHMFRLGGRLPRVEAIVRSQSKQAPGALHTLYVELPATSQRPAINIYYHLFSSWKQIIQNPEAVFLVNDWTIDHYQFRHFQSPIPLLLGNYGQKSQQTLEDDEEPGFIPASEMADLAQGIKRVGYLRMDVDRLGQIFAKGLGVHQTLPRLAELSRQMSYFFKIYLNSLAKNRQDNFFQPCQTVESLKDGKYLTAGERLDLLFIYAGGDDLFVSGAWNQVVEFAFDVYQSFRAYTGWHPDITLSGGISIDDAKFPLYQAAEESGKAEDAAKGNGRNSLGLFSQVFKWDEWLGITAKNLTIIDESVRNYLKLDALPELLGIFPVVAQLDRLEINYARSFVRNLLLTAQIQEQVIQQNQEKPKEYQQAIRYYLHLPRVAYTLARLPSQVREHQDFLPVRTSLKSPYNAPYFRAIATWLELLNRA